MARRDRSPLEEGEKRRLNKENLKKLRGIFRYLRPYIGKFILGMIFLTISSLTLLSFPYFIGILVDAASGKPHWFFNGINETAIILIIILLLQSVFSYFRVSFFASVSERGMADIRVDLFKRYMMLPMSFYDSKRVGELISRITNDISLLRDTFSTTLAEFIRQILNLVVGTIIIFFITRELTLFMISIFPVVVVIALIFGRYIRKLSKKTQDTLAKSNIIVDETLQSIQVVKAFANEIFEFGRYRKGQDEVVKYALKTAHFRGAFISFVILALFGAIVAVIWYGAILVQNDQLQIGSLTAFVLYTIFIGGSIGGLGDLYTNVQRAIGASERVLEILDEKTEAYNSEGGAGVRLQGNIEFANINFTYPTRPEVPVLQGLSLSVSPGEKVALVGHSGAGKSTIVQLLLRFYEFDNGQITIDGQSINQYPLEAYRNRFGIVPQEVILFGGSIKENIAYGNLSASEEEIVDAARQANAMQFIETFPEGLDTVVGERGVKLSGGQKQRVAIARAILRNPDILILDEATSSLDAESERLVQEALEKLMAHRTTIIIAHRLATIRKVDKIYVIDKGQLIESGTHQELSEISDGIYNNLVKLQFELS